MPRFATARAAVARVRNAGSGALKKARSVATKARSSLAGKLRRPVAEEKQSLLKTYAAESRAPTTATIKPKARKVKTDNTSRSTATTVEGGFSFDDAFGEKKQGAAREIQNAFRRRQQRNTMYSAANKMKANAKLKAHQLEGKRQYSLEKLSKTASRKGKRTGGVVRGMLAERRQRQYQSLTEDAL